MTGNDAQAADRTDAGFTLLEVMMALLIAIIGLMGTVAVQQTMLNATINSNESATAQRLAMQVLEEFNARVTRPGVVCPGPSPPPDPGIDLLGPIVGASWTNPVYRDSQGKSCGSNPTTACRFMLETRVTIAGGTTGVPGAPYNLSVRVTYNLDGGRPKMVQMDAERRKCW